MARKIKTVTIALDNRDAGKSFVITEMPAVQAEKWAARALLAMSRSGVEIPEDALSAGAATLLAAGLRSFTSMAFADAEPLLDEMFQCIQFLPDPGKPDVVRALVESDIDEVATRLFLRGEVIEIHTGFSVTAALSNLGAAAKAEKPISGTSTSRKSSARSSRGGKQRSTNCKPSTV